MSGSGVIWKLLTADAPVLALVPAVRIKGGTLPESTALPSIAITSISTLERIIPSPGAKVRMTERVQVSILAKKYPDLKSILTKVRQACRDKRAATGYTGVLVLTDTTGPDDFGDELAFYMQTQDFIVTYDENH